MGRKVLPARSTRRLLDLISSESSSDDDEMWDHIHSKISDLISNQADEDDENWDDFHVHPRSSSVRWSSCTLEIILEDMWEDFNFECIKQTVETSLLVSPSDCYLDLFVKLNKNENKYRDGNASMTKLSWDHGHIEDETVSFINTTIETWDDL